MLELQIMKLTKKTFKTITLAKCWCCWKSKKAKGGMGILFNSSPFLYKCDDLMLIHCTVYFLLYLHVLIFVWFYPSLIEIFSLIFQCIVSFSFFHLFFMFHPYAGSSLKQDDVWRMQLNGSYRNRGLNLRLLFITCAAGNKSLFLVLTWMLKKINSTWVFVYCLLYFCMYVRGWNGHNIPTQKLIY